MPKKISFELGVTVLLGALLIVFFIKSVIFHRPTLPEVVPVLRNQSIETDIFTLDLSKKEEAELQWGADPFRSPEPQREKRRVFAHSVAWNLSGISWSHERAAAIINDQIVHEGDLIEDFRVHQIIKDCVILQKGDQILELRPEGEKE